MIDSAVGSARRGGPTEPLRLRPWVRYDKEEVFEICGALALAETLLTRLGREVEASRMAVVFDLVEGRLGDDPLLEASGSPPYGWPPAGRPSVGSKARASELTQ
jgi:hypothetical protein